LDRGFWSGYGIALDTMAVEPANCFNSVHCKAFMMLDSFSDNERATAALAAHIALTEEPQVKRYHATARSAPIFYFYYSLISCPNGIFELDDLRYC
jgi:hypothetical protein